jgi:hypothetical protein
LPVGSGVRESGGGTILSRSRDMLLAVSLHLGQRRLAAASRAEPGPSRAAADVVQPHLAAEVDRGWFPTVLPEDPDLQSGASLAALRD